MMNRMSSGCQVRLLRGELLWGKVQEGEGSLTGPDWQGKGPKLSASGVGSLHVNSIKIYHLGWYYKVIMSKQQLMGKLKEFTENMRNIKKLTASGSVSTLPST